MISNDVRQRAYAFTQDFADAKYEKGEAQTFWGQFFAIFGIQPGVYKSFFEKHTSAGFIDALWPGYVAVEHKSTGKDLDEAYRQARNYVVSLPANEHPKAIIVCDFQTFRIYSLSEEDGYNEFKLKDLPRQLHQFQFLLDGREVRISAEEDPVNLKAAELMGKLHDRLAERKYTGEQLEVLLVRIMFMFFADDTGIFGERDYLTGYLERNTRDDGTDMGSVLNFLFDLVNKQEEDRPDDYPANPELNQFRYINGGLFESFYPPAPFDSQARDTLLECARFDWAKVSPAIFGSMFQNVMTAETRRNLGAHYTSEANILKVINPLFMDNYRDQFEKAYSNRAELRRLLERIKNTGIFDPACGCGNFLVISYRELRSLEIDIWKRLAELEHWEKAISLIDTAEQFAGINVDNMYGIEIEEFPSQIARAALWLQDHIMNMKVSEAFGSYYVRLPLTHSPHILNENALRVPWEVFAPQSEVSFIASNPPYRGAMVMDDDQREDMRIVFETKQKSYGVLDYVAAWIEKYATYAQGKPIDAGFVTTNSIVQGEQVSLLWQRQFETHQVRFRFAHETFAWSNEAARSAAVHVVILGLTLAPATRRTIFEYENPLSPPHPRSASNINAYLVDAPTVFIPNRSQPLCNVNPMRFGSMARDGGNLFLSETERSDLVEETPEIEPFVRRFFGPREFFYNTKRYCLWLMDASPQVIRKSPILRERVRRTRDFRLKSKAKSTRNFADTPHLFCQIAQPTDERSIFVPRHSSERREYVPIGFMKADFIIGDAALMIPGASAYEFGVVSSKMHLAWMRRLAGRLKSDYRYSRDVVYNNFPWPKSPADSQKGRVESAAQAVLDSRQVYLDQGQTLADLYDPLSMPAGLLKAHRTLDAAVDRCYRKQAFTDERNRLKYLFALYQHYVTGEKLKFEE